MIDTAHPADRLTPHLQALHYDPALTCESTPDGLDFSELGTACTHIAGAENRGITTTQLLQLRSFLVDSANAGGWLPWTDRAPRKYSVTSGLRLNARTINLYQAPTT